MNFLRITLVLSVNVQQGMIDFTQVYSRAGKQGEGVNSVASMEEGRIDHVQDRMHSPDEQVTLEFVPSPGCREKSTAHLLDVIKPDCMSDEHGLAVCDSYGNSWFVLEWQQRQFSETSATVERVLIELVEDCPASWNDGTFSHKSLFRDLQDRLCNTPSAGLCLLGEEYERVAEHDIRFVEDMHSCVRGSPSQSEVL